MSIETVQVNTNICYNDGTPAKGVLLVAELQSPSQTDDGYIINKLIKSTVNELGEVSLELWPNEAGNVDTFYKIYAEDKCLGRLLDTVAVVPQSNIPLELEDIAMPINSFSLGQSSGNVASIRRVDTDEGLTGGGDLSTNRNHRLDYSTLSTEEQFPPGDWVVAVQDRNQPDTIRYTQLGNLPGLGFDTVENSIAVAGQDEVFITRVFAPNANQIDLYIDGIYQCPGDYDEELIIDPDFAGKLILDPPLNGGEEICVKIKQNSPFSISADAGNITYSGGGSVEDALNSLFSASDVNPFKDIEGANYNAVAGDQLFVSTDLGSLEIFLPLNPNKGDRVSIIDVTSSGFINPGNDLVNSFTINRNGNNIMELPENLVVDQAKVSLDFIYTGATIGWVFSE